MKQHSVGRSTQSPQSKGGVARKEKLSPEKRKEIATKAAEARWGEKLPSVTHAGIITIGDVEISCFVTEDGTRVISGRGMTKAIGMKGRGQGIQRIVTHGTLKPFINSELKVAIEKPIRLSGPGSRVIVPTAGYEATVLLKVCDAIMDAQDAGVLKTAQELRYAQHCGILVRAFAKVGIIALVDEATGYQADRARDALEKILEQFISVELSKWVKTFPDEFYRQLFRLREINAVQFSPRKPQYVGHLTRIIQEFGNL